MTPSTPPSNPKPAAKRPAATAANGRRTPSRAKAPGNGQVPPANKASGAPSSGGSSGSSSAGGQLVPQSPATPTSPSSATSLDTVQSEKNIQGQFNEFIGSLGNLLADFTALEVSTMVVTEISGDKFNAVRTYRALYYLRARLDHPEQMIPNLPAHSQTPIPGDLRPAYEALYEQLEENYHLCFPDDRAKPLPHPDDHLEQVQVLVRDTAFLRALRKLAEQKLALDGGDVTSTTKDLIYAQTVMQLDGDVINRYHKDLLENPELRDFVVGIHHQAVESGQRQWRELIDFMVGLLQNFLPKSK